MKNFIGKIIFPSHPEWEREREREAAVLVATVLFALVFAGIVGMVIYWRNNIGR